jgi:pimeloyl-ACP methyl ester carboxylesterase
LTTIPRTANPPRRPHPTQATSTRRRKARPAAAVTQHETVLHGQPVTYLETGADSGGPVVVLLHGLASSSQTWATVMPLLGTHTHVIAPDLLGHGMSAKPRSGDYSLGAYATGLRDLLIALDVPQATIAGHSFGGGVAMQFAYQFPERTQRMVLVASGGLGHDVTVALRAATLPGTALALRVAAALTPRWLAHIGVRLVRVIPTVPKAEIDGPADAFDSFADHGARKAFTHTVRGALNMAGQRLDGTERLYLLADTPVLFVAGNRDSVIPIAHTRTAHDVLPDSRLEIFDNAGHFPHIDQPQRFAHLLCDFLVTATPAEVDTPSMRRQLRDH